MEEVSDWGGVAVWFGDVVSVTGNRATDPAVNGAEAEGAEEGSGGAWAAGSAGAKRLGGGGSGDSRVADIGLRIKGGA